MMSLQEFRASLTDESLRFAVLVGLASIPFTLALSWNPLAEEGITIGGPVSGSRCFWPGWWSATDTANEPLKAVVPGFGPVSSARLRR